jgi:hypothetical protein
MIDVPVHLEFAVPHLESKALFIIGENKAKRELRS